MRTLRTLAIVIFVLLIVAAVLAVMNADRLRGMVGSGRNEEGIEVRIERAASRSLVESVAAPGEIEPLTQVQISTEVSAQIVQLPVREGDTVRKGDLLALLDDRDLQATLRSAEARRDGEKYRLEADRASLAGQQGRLDFARRELERMQTLYESGDVPLRDYDNALERVEDIETSIQSTTWQIATAESSLAAAEAEIQRSQDGLSKTSLLAPMDGTITLLNVEVGEVVTGSFNNPGTVLMTISDLGRMLHIAEVAESDIGRIEVGQAARLHINGFPDDVFSGRVTHIALQRSGAPDGTGHFRTEIEIERRGRLIRSGHVANVDIEIKAHEGIVIPYQAIVARKTDELPREIRDHELVDKTRTMTPVVYRVVDGKAVCTPVETGPSDVTHRLIKRGLGPDEEVIVGPYKVLEELEDGDAVRTIDEEADESESGDAPTEVATDADGNASDTATADASGDDS